MQRLAIRRKESTISAAVSALATIALGACLIAGSPHSATAAVDHDAILRDRLDDVRELLERRQAHRSMLTEKIERFSSDLNALQAERDAALSALADIEGRARAHERELDRLIPRLLPRLATLDRFRRNGARALAGLASMERSADLEEKTRARYLAARTKSINQMRRASTAVRLLRRAPNALATHHRDLDFQIPLLTAAAGRLELRQSQLQRRRDSAVRDLAELNVDIERLTAEERRLARNVLARNLEATDNADADPAGRKTTLTSRRYPGKAQMEEAAVRGVAFLETQPTPVARPADGLRASVEPAAGVALWRGPGASIDAKATASAAARSVPDALPTPKAEATAADSLSARVDIGGLGNAPPPLSPTIETITFNLAASGLDEDRSAIAIPAHPRQRVAAPHDGRAVFAGEFRSYGLLLIIEHRGGYHTLIWGFISLDVRLGDEVRAGQIVGVLSGERSPKLYVELRRNGQPVSPEVWLAASSSGIKG
jgi:murein DD-endopeptidase MepM/ murein hydrolase activator NlpD